MSSPDKSLDTLETAAAQKEHDRKSVRGSESYSGTVMMGKIGTRQQGHALENPAYVGEKNDSADHVTLSTDQGTTKSLDIDNLSELQLKTQDPTADGTTQDKAKEHPAITAQIAEDQRNETYLDPTPKTPRQSTSPSRTPQDSINVPDDEASTSEIQSILDQFDTGDDIYQTNEAEAPIHESGKEPSGTLVERPPRTSSLEPLGFAGQQLNIQSAAESQSGRTFPDPSHQASEAFPVISIKDKALPPRNSNLPQDARFGTSDGNTPISSQSTMSLPKLLPPDPDPEPDLPFDFHRFLEQLRHRTADPVAKFLRSFLIEFGKKQWMVHEQVKIINDFLAFITNKMAQCEVWRGVSDAEFDNAKEGMEKLVMNRLYSQTFSPAIPAPILIPGSKGKKKNMEKDPEPGRRGQHQEDIERDEILGQKVRIYGWVQEEHLDIQPVGNSGRRFLVLAQQELLKIKTYRAPRDKVICVLNCCKVIFGLLRNSKAGDTSADSFVPLLIYVVLHANPDHLVSNIQYILRFRNQDKLGGEAGYYLSSLMGAIQFIENLDKTSLSVSDADFEINVEAAVSAIVERHQEQVPSPSKPPRTPNPPQISEKSGLSQPEVIPRNSIEAEYSTPRTSASIREIREYSTSSDEVEENSVAGLLRTIQRPLSSLGRMFSEEPGPPWPSGPVSHTYPPPRLSPAVFKPPSNGIDAKKSTDVLKLAETAKQTQGIKLSAEDAAARQASAEAAEAQRIQRAEHCNVVETLAGMFPDLDKDIIDDVVRMKQGRVGLAVDACLALIN